MNDRKRRWLIAALLAAALLISVVPLGLKILIRRNFENYGISHAKTHCRLNLQAIQGSKETWRLENHKDTNVIPTDADLFGVTAYIREKPTCPAGGTYTLGSVGAKPRCTVAGHTL